MLRLFHLAALGANTGGKRSSWLRLTLSLHKTLQFLFLGAVIVLYGAEVVRHLIQIVCPVCTSLQYIIHRTLVKADQITIAAVKLQIDLSFG